MPPLSKPTVQFQRSLAQVIAFPTLILVMLAAILVVQILSLLSLSNWVDHTDQVIAQATLTQKLILDQEVGQRGFFVGGDPRFLEPSIRADSQIGPAFDRLGRLVADNPEQTRRVGALELGYAQWAANARLELALYRRSPGLERQYFNQKIGKGLMDRLRGQFGQFISTEEGLRAVRQSAAQDAGRRTLSGLAILAIVTGLLLGIIVVRQMRRVAALYEGALAASQKNAALMAATLRSIGDAVLVTDARGRITDMNPISEALTGWPLAEARGLESGKVFVIVNETTRLRVENPVDRVLKEGITVGLANHTVLLRRGGLEVPIDDSGAPIHNDAGELVGAVLVFRDITERRRAEQDRAALYEKEHRIAESLQRSLLSRPPSELLGNLSVETLYHPAWEEAQVGGDFYDIIALEEGRTALVVGDVSGKGLLAASRTAEAKYTLRAYLREYAHAAPALTRFNAFLCESQMLEIDTPEYFICLTLAVISPANGQMEIAAAGMEPPLLLRPDRQAEELQVSGIPLGITPKAEYEAILQTLEAGHILMIATDGLTEARQGNNLLGNDGMARLAAQSLPAQDLLSLGEGIVDGARAYAGGMLCDDVCLLLAVRSL